MENEKNIDSKIISLISCPNCGNNTTFTDRNGGIRCAYYFKSLKRAPKHKKVKL